MRHMTVTEGGEEQRGHAVLKQIWINMNYDMFNIVSNWNVPGFFSKML